MSDTNEVDEIVTEFLVESYEGLDDLDRDLVLLETAGNDKELLGRIFRCIHTVKGTCGFLGFSLLESVAHVGENLLSKLRDGALTVTPELTSALLSLVDAIRKMLQNIEATGNEGNGDYSALIAELIRLQDPDAVRAAAPAPVATPVVAEAPAPAAPAAPMPEDYLDDILPVRAGSVRPSEPAPVAAPAAAPVAAPVAAPAPLAAAPAPAATNSNNNSNNDHDASEGKSQGVADASIRVDVGLLDKLMTLVGELVLARNQILQYTNSTTQGTVLHASSQRLNLLTTELQEGVMKTRMQPIGSIWSKFPRVVRDLAVACNKQIRLEMEGRETELDKTIIEAIKDPLTHIVRNAADHGIEVPETRIARGKPVEGQLLLRAYHEGGQVNIEITDDGGGLNAERLKQKAVDMGVMSSDQAARMSDREALNLIFHPGLSTAAKVTNISGRGVGMDVVKTNIEKIGGVVDVHSVLGKGTTLKIKIPLTLAIIPGLIITTCNNRYAIPQVSLLELVRLDSAEAKQGLEMIYGAPVFRLRGNLLPLVHLNHALDFTPNRWDMSSFDAVNIVVLQADGTPFGLVVDEINDTEEIVVKPLGRQLKGIPAFAGATIMGDGRVALILDVMGLAQQGRVVGQKGERAGAKLTDGAAGGNDESQTLLLFGFDTDRRMAVPLSAIARLEEFPRGIIERTGRHEVVQYRDRIMPIVRLRDILDGISPSYEDPDMLQVVVYSHNDQSIGLVVDRILDIVQTDASVQRRNDGGAVLGSAVIQGKVTDILDLHRLVTSLEGSLLDAFSTTTAGV
ncbi:MAG: chemotaxis protein CheA [Gemmatimonas sp.]